METLSKSFDAKTSSACARVVAEPEKKVLDNRMLAERTGFEPATPGVTGRYSNQLNYRSELGGEC